MNQLQVLEHNDQRVMTTRQLAEVFETAVDNINQNFARNKKRFIAGKHYHVLKGADLKRFKEGLPSESQEPFKCIPHLILWTERGANVHSKILDTDKAWEQFEVIEETYFRVKHDIPQIQEPSVPDAVLELMGEMLESLGRCNDAVKSLADRVTHVESQYVTLPESTPTPASEPYEQVLCTATEVAAMFGMQARAFNSLLRSKQIIKLRGNAWRLNARYKDKGYAINHWKQLRWTEPGIEFLKKKLKTYGKSALS